MNLIIPRARVQLIMLASLFLCSVLGCASTPKHRESSPQTPSKTETCTLSNTVQDVELTQGLPVLLPSGLTVIFKGEIMEHGMEGHFDVIGKFTFKLDKTEDARLVSHYPNPQGMFRVLGHCFELTKLQKDRAVLKWAPQ